MRYTRRTATPPKENTCVVRTTARKNAKKAPVRVRKASRRIWRNASRSRTRPHHRISRRTTTRREIIRRAWETTAARAVIEGGEDGADDDAAATGALTGTVAGGIYRLRSMLRRRVSVIRVAMIGEQATADRLRLLLRAAKMTFCCRANRSRSTAGARRNRPSSR